jgi:hypothetical protein
MHNDDPGGRQRSGWSDQRGGDDHIPVAVLDGSTLERIGLNLGL